MSEREKYPELIVRFNAGELEGEELRQFIELLKKTPKLQEEVALDKEINEYLSEENLLDLRRKMLSVQKEKTGDKNRNFFYLLAASLLLLLSIGVFLFSQMSKDKTRGKSNITHTGNDGVVNSQKSVPVITDLLPQRKDKEKPVQLASNFQPDPAYESLAGNIMRSDKFELLQPTAAQIFRKNGNILFRWDMPDGKKLMIRIVNNKGKQILEYSVNDLHQLEIPVKRLPPGLFYYKILEDDEILFVGKFSIE